MNNFYFATSLFESRKLFQDLIQFIFVLNIFNAALSILVLVTCFVNASNGISYVSKHNCYGVLLTHLHRIFYIQFIQIQNTTEWHTIDMNIEQRLRKECRFCIAKRLHCQFQIIHHCLALGDVGCLLKEPQFSFRCGIFRFFASCHSQLASLFFYLLVKTL